MKNLFLPLLFLLVVLASCTNNSHKGASISGHIRNAANSKVYLNHIVGNQLVAIDSTIVKGDQTFRFLTNEPKTHFYIISVVSSNRKVTKNLQLLVGPTQQILIEADLSKNLKMNYTISGSGESAQIQELNKRLFACSQSLDSVGEVFRKETAKNGVDSTLKAKLDKINKDTYLAHRAYSERVIEENDSSLVSIMALFQHLGRHETVFNLTTDYEIFKKVLDRMTPLYPESEMVKSLRIMVTAQKGKAKNENTNKAIVEVGSIAPEIILPTPTGKELALSSLRGKYVLLDFWAAWCGPCRRENPTLVQNYKKYYRKGFTIYQVSLDNNKEHWTKAIRKDKLKWYHVSDLKHWKSEAAKLYNVRTIPTNFLINPEGEIIATNLRGKRLEEKLKEIFLY